MPSVRIVFMGSPAFAVPVLEALAGVCQVVGVVTQPDRPAGRGSRLRPPPVKLAAQRLGLPVYQPESVRDVDTLTRLAAWGPRLIVVAAFGQILPRAVLQLPAYGCLNLHASLLPRWRGAAPVAAAILAGDPVTGVTLMKMEEGLDSGPILVQRQEAIAPDDTAGSLSERLSRLAGALIVEALPAYLRGDLLARPQPEEGVTYCRPLKKEDGWLDWRRPAAHLERQVRAMTPWPGAFTTWQGQRLRVRRARVRSGTPRQCPGTVVSLGDGVGVVTGEEVLQLLEVQAAGRRPMPIEDFLRGHRGLPGAVLGQEVPSR